MVRSPSGVVVESRQCAPHPHVERGGPKSTSVLTPGVLRRARSGQRGITGKRHVRRMLRIVQQAADARRRTCVSRSLLPPVFRLRSYFGNSADDTVTRSRWPGSNTRDVNQRSMSYFSTLPGVSGTSLSNPLPEPRPRHAILHTLGVAVGEDVEQHDVPVGVLARRSPPRAWPTSGRSPRSAS